MRADTASVGFRLRTARGHLDAVIRMAAEDRYCVDLLHQLSAVQGALDRVHRDVLEAHLRGCIPETLAQGNTDDLVEELMAATFGTEPGTQPHLEHCVTDDGICSHRG